MAANGIEIDLNNIPESPEDALALLAQLESGAEPAAAPAAAAPQPAAPAAQPVEEVKVASEPEKETQNPTEPSEADAAGVATKDGKHVIPYAVLTSTRERALRAEEAAREMAARVTALEQSLQAAAKGANTGAAPRAAEAVAADATERMSDADLEALKEDFPTVYKALRAATARADQLEQQVREQASFRQEVEGASQRDVEMTVQDAIDSVPKLAHIQASDPQTFALAKQFDDTLKNTPAWANKPMQERFAKVIEMVEAANGAIDLPGGKSNPEVPAPNAEDLKKAAQATAAAAVKTGRSNVPTSLSEFPVGDPPAQTETQALEQMTQFQLAEKFARMTPEQQDAYLASL